jgi:hypothetical protein
MGSATCIHPMSVDFELNAAGGAANLPALTIFKMVGTPD